MLTRKVAAAYIRPGSEPGQGLLNRIEMAFRSFDPCFSCATHSLPGRMPMRVRIHRGGRLERELTRGAGGDR
jgi:F420-non-reducing hydrogenase large subunit